MKRLSRFTMGVAGALLALAAALYLFREPLFAPRLIALANDALRREAGIELAVDRVGGTYLTGLTLANVRLRPVAGAAWSADFDRLELDYSLVSLWLGSEAFVRQLAVDIRGGRLRLGPGSDTALEGGTPLTLPLLLPKITARDLDIDLERQGLAGAIRGLTMKVGAPLAAAAVQPVTLQAAAVSVSRPVLRPQPVSVAMRLGLRVGSLEIASFKVDDQELVEKAAIHWDDAGVVTGEADCLAFGGRLGLAARVAAGRIRGSARFAKVDIGRLGALFVDSRGWSGPASGEADFSLSGAEPLASLEGSLRLGLPAGYLMGWQVTDIELAASLAGGQLELSRASGRLGENRLRLQGASLPLATLAGGEVAAVVPALRIDRLTAECDDLPALAAAFGGPRLEPAAMPPHHLSLAGSLKGGRLTFDQGEFASETGRIALRQAAIDVSGWQRPLSMPFALSLQADIADLARIAALFGIQGLAGSLTGDIEAHGTPARPRGSLALSGDGLTWKGIPLGTAELAAASDGNRLEVKRLNLRRGGDRLAAAGALDLARGTIERARGELVVADAADYLASLLPAGERVGGRLTLEVEAAGPLPWPTTDVRLTLAHGSWRGQAIPAASARLTADSYRITVTEATVETRAGTLTIAGEASGIGTTDQTAALETLTFKRPDLLLSLAAPARIVRHADGRVSTAGLALKGSAGSVSLAGSLTPGGPLDLRLEISGASGGDWLASLAGDRLRFAGGEATVRLGGTTDRPVCHLTASVRTLRWQALEQPLAGRVALAYSGEGIEILQLRLAAPTGQRLELHGRLPYDPLAASPFLTGTINLEAELLLTDLRALVGQAEERLPGGSLRASLALGGSWQHPVGRLKLASRNLTLPAALRPAPPWPLSIDCDLEVRSNRLAFHELRIASAGLTAGVSGVWADLPPLPALIAGSAPSGSLDLAGELEARDIGWLAVGSDTIRRLSGSLQGRFRLSGPAAAPAVTGEAQLSEGDLRFTAGLPPVRDLALEARFDGDTVRLEEGRGRLGGAPFTLGGELRRQRQELLCDLTLHGENILFLRNEGITARGDADIAITGPLSRLAMRGKVKLTEGSYRRNVDFLSLLRGGKTSPPGGLELFSLTAPPFRDAAFDIRLEATNAFAIRNNMARGSVRPQLVLGGTGELPLLTGEVYVDPTRISLPAGRLTIQSGVVRFSQATPGRPSFELTATARLAGYDITMLIEGTPEEPVITLSSVPPLPDDELLLLVLTGRPPESAAGNGSRQTGMKMAMYLGRGLLAKWFGSGEEADETLLDRFDLEVGRDVTRQGEDTVEAQFRLAEGVLLPGDRLFITSEKDVFDDFNAGVKIVFRFR